MIEERIQRVFETVFRGKLAFSPTLQMSMEPTWDSLKHVQLVVALEQEFDVRFDGADAASMLSVKDILDTISARTSA